MVAEQVVDRGLDEVFAEYRQDPGADKLVLVASFARPRSQHFAGLYAPGQPRDDVIQAGFEGLQDLTQVEVERCLESVSARCHGYCTAV